MAILAVVSLALTGCSRSGSESDAADSPDSSVSPGEQSTSGSDGPEQDGDRDGDGDGDDSTPTPEEAGQESLPVPDEVRDETGETTDDYVDTVSDVLEQPDSSRKTVPTVTGAALEQLLNTIAEYESSGWKVVGEPVIVRQRVVKYFDDPESAVVRACLDNSDVRVVDAQGRTVPGSVPADPRTLNLFTMVKKQGDWVISESRPAARPDC